MVRTAGGTDVILDERCRHGRDEPMAMHPFGVRPAGLYVDELTAAPTPRSGCASERDAVQLDVIIDERRPACDRCGREDLESHLGWRDALEVRGVREEREYVVAEVKCWEVSRPSRPARR